MTNVPILKFMFHSDWKALSEALQFNPANKPHEFNSANEVVTFLEGTTAGLIIASLTDKNDLIQIATLMKFLKQSDSEICFKIAVVNTSGDKQFEKAIAKLGILDLLEPKIQMKSLRFKIDYMMKSVTSQIKKKESAVATKVKSLETKTALDKKAASNSPVWTDPLNCEDDIWIIRNESDCKKILSRWLVKLIGPSPYVSGWVESTTRGVWKFEFKVSKDAFEKGTGSWYFQGDQKPDYIWAENAWSFTGNSFELFYKSDTTQLSRMKLEGNQFTVARTSEYAKQKEKDIQESFDKNLVLKNTQEESSKNSFENDEDEFKNLEGKGKTEALNHKALSGKSNTSHLNTDPLKMDLDPNENEDSKDPHSQKTSTSKGTSFWKGNNKYDKDEKEAGELSTEIDKASLGAELSLKGNSEHKSHYKNHNEPEKFEAHNDPHSQKTSTSKGTSFWKGKNEYKEDEASGELSAPVDKVNEGSELSNQNKGQHEKFLRNHNEAEKFDAKEKSHSLTKDEVTKNLQGKIGTDKNKAKDAPELTGASSTEKMKGHLTSPSQNAKEKEKASKPENNQTSTDNQKDAPVSENTEVEKEKIGKPSKDNLGGYLSSQNANREPSKDALKMADRLSELRAKKEKLDKENKANSEKKIEIEKVSREEKAAQEAAKTRKKNSTDAKTVAESSEVKPSIQNKKTAEDLQGNILTFPEKEINKSFENMSLGSKDLDDATLNASITSVLVQDLVKVSCHLDDHFDQSILFTTRESSLSLEKPVSLDLNFNYLNKKSNMKFLGKITQIDSDEDGLNYITVEISQENVAAFNSFMQMYQTRQSNIDLFLKTVKGF